MVSGLQNMTNMNSLHVLGLKSAFETRMIKRADLIKVFKILNNIDRVVKDKFFTLALDDRRGH